MVVAGVKIPCIDGFFLVISYSRELSFCGPCGPYFCSNYYYSRQMKSLEREIQRLDMEQMRILKDKENQLFQVFSIYIYGMIVYPWTFLFLSLV